MIVHLARLRDGRRVVFAFRPRAGVSGTFEATGGEPVMAAVLAERGAPADHGLFEPGEDA